MKNPYLHTCISIGNTHQYNENDYYNQLDAWTLE